jgi:hypothetical protein
MAKKKAIQDANLYSNNKGMRMMPVHSSKSTQRDFLGDMIPTYDFTFRCLVSGDHGLQRPKVQKQADIIIKNR